MTKKIKNDDKRSTPEKADIPTIAFAPHAKKIMEHLSSNGGSTNRTAIEDLIDIHGGALNHVIRSMKFYNLMTRPEGGLKFTFTPMSEGFMHVDEAGKKKIYGKAVLSVDIFKRLVMDKNFSSKPKFATLRKVFANEYKISGSQSAKLANIFLKNWDELGVDFAYFKKLTSEVDDLHIPVATSRGRNDSIQTFAGSFDAQKLALELAYTVSKPRELCDIVNDIIDHRHEFSIEKQALVDTLERARDDENKLKIVAEAVAESLADIPRKVTEKKHQK